MGNQNTNQNINLDTNQNTLNKHSLDNYLNVLRDENIASDFVKKVGGYPFNSLMHSRPIGDGYRRAHKSLVNYYKRKNNEEIPKETPDRILTSQITINDDLFHSNNDEPAKIERAGSYVNKYWYHYGELHRAYGTGGLFQSGPAVIRQLGFVCKNPTTGNIFSLITHMNKRGELYAWYLYGRVHRYKGPAVELFDYVVDYAFEEGKNYKKIKTANGNEISSNETTNDRDDKDNKEITRNKQESCVEEYWQHGRRHREDGPAIIVKKDFQVDIPVARFDFYHGLPLTMDFPVQQEWWLNGKIGRVDYTEPSIVNDNVKIWCYDGKIHRMSGPAVVYQDGTQEWWINGYKVY